MQTTDHPALQRVARLQNRVSFGMTGVFCLSFLLYGAISVFFPEVLAQKVTADGPMTYAVLVSILLIVSYVAGALYYLHAMNHHVEALKQKAKSELRSTQT